MSFTDDEKKVLTLLFKLFDQILEFSGGYFDTNDHSFDRGDLFRLAEKIGIDY